MELDGRPVGPEQLAALALGNYGHFTSMLVEAGRVRGLSLHWQRLVADSRVMFDAELDPDRVRALVRRVEPAPAVVVRVTVFAPDLPLGNPGRQVAPQVLVSTRPAPAQRPTPLRLRSTAYQRELATVKHVGLCGAVWHRRAAQRAGFDDVVFVDPAARICEGATWNIGFVDDRGAIVWPVGDCLPGVTMRLLDAACADRGGGPVHRAVQVPDAVRMRGAFVTNAAVGVRPVASLDAATYRADDAPLSGLTDAYRAVVAEPL
ncbi:MAG TPA: aminotransferase class IV [Catenuloplanes sp.]|jgi:branched-subunit amino acid aminotransferase/4-amino-4-deoxychorismate lyase